ncbi:MAG: hypothetical protein J6584_04690 [Lactobacillus sp.]|uniref:PTS sorbitol transporter subunit IIA n=1 Tax=Bombilactobacillus bombi TaxID=1303590 RepID=A0A3R6V704_9LACO|nr:PTS glucitol/sorbitol transporter subunit IIA [Bombilactobacillus bombi]MCO6543241.1 hypothetical protein [Lactobacillus sp.]RHW47403.1 hypothetical protein DS832_04460 [Bombilactobacillus bombi]
MEITAEVTFIGNQAVDEQTNFLLLFDESASEDLQQVAIIQHFLTSRNQFKLDKHAQLIIDQTLYPINFVGDLVNSQLSTIGHAVLAFDKCPAEPLPNSIYLDGPLPKLHLGSKIVYQMGD